MALRVPLTDEQKFQATDFSKRDEVIALFPLYKREQLASKKALPKSVNIPNFTMKTPYKDKTLLNNAELILEPNRRQALFGPNSCGKTLLFTYMLNGEIEGFPTHLHVHHCKELEEHEMGDTVLNTVTKSNPYLNLLFKIEAKIKELQAADPAPAPEVASGLKSCLELVTTQISSIGGFNAKDTAVKMLRVLGFDEIGQDKPVSALSGGLKMRVALCMAFFIGADMLLLDEPTNHLDFPSVLWLENRLRGYKGSFLLVSHDRELLKNVCTGVLLMEDLQIKYYNMGFIEFEKKVSIEQKKKYEEIEKFCKKHENANAATPIGRQRMDKKAWADTYHAKLVALQSKFTFPPPVALTNPDGSAATVDQQEMSLINLQNLTFSYNVETGHFIFAEPIDFHVKLGTRVGVMGPNGAGKSTLLKLLTYKLKATTGTVTHHPNFKLAYFGQHSTAELDLDMTPMTFMTDAFPKYNIGQLRQHLGKTGIVGNIADTRIRGLSYSQRSCCIFAKLTLESPHLLILDEPTNFLDLESVDSLIAACNKYRGALLLVSHNRDFLKKCAKQYLSVVPGHFELYDDLKTAEKATYTFIQEMEEGGKISGKSAIMENPGGGTIHSSQKVGDKAAASTSSSADPAKKPAAPSAASAAPSAAPSFALNDKIQAKFSEDGKWYTATIKEIKGGKYKVLYLEYGNNEWLPITELRKFAAPANVKKAGPPAASAKKGAAAPRR